MSTLSVPERINEVSPRTKARMAGGFFLATILTGVFTQQFISRPVFSGDAAATAANILSHESVFRLGFAVYLVELACQITMTALMYDLLKPVSRSGSLLAAIFGLVGCTVKILSRLFFFAPLLVLGASRMAGYILSFAVVAGFSTALWLLVFGVNEQHWREQAKAAGQ